MCDPRTASQIGVYSQGANTLFGALNASNAADAARAGYAYEARVAENNASLAERQAADAIDRGHQVAGAVRKQGKAVKGAQHTAFAAGNVDASFGSALDILTETDVMTDVDANQAQQNAGNEAWALRVQAGNYRDQARLLKFQRKSTSPLLAGGTALLDGATKVADKWYQHNLRYGSGNG